MYIKTKILLFIFVILIGFLVFWIAKKQLTWTATLSGQVSSAETNNSIPELSVQELINQPIVSPTSSFDNNSIWFFDSRNRLFEINADGSNLSQYPLPSINFSIKRTLWPKTGPDFIAVASNNTKYYYNGTAHLFVALAPNVQYLDWLPDGKRVAYVWKSADGKSQQLILADADGSGFRKISDVFWPDLAVSAGNDGKTVLLYRTNPDATNKIYAANLQTNLITTLIEQGKNVAAKWLPKGNKFLYEQNSSAGSKIYLYDYDSQKSIDIGLATNLDKVAVDADGLFLYAFVGDKFIRMDLTNYESQDYLVLPNPISANNLFLVGNTIYFTDRDGKLDMISK